MWRKTGILAALVFLASPLFAAQTLTVEALVSPAWVERAGTRQPLAAGMTLENKDKVHTGEGARALLRLSEGSAVKLGANAVLAVDDLLEKQGASAQKLVTASLDVVRGAFRFTTGVFGRPSAERDVRIRVVTVTAGIRGTDLWGKSEAERDIVCLIEGRVAVEHDSQRFTMQDPLSFFIAPRQGKPGPVAPVSKQQIDQWSEETEIREGGGAIRRGGRYEVDLTGAVDQGAALQSRDKARAAGFPAEIETVSSGYGSSEYRARIANLPTMKDAQAAAGKLKSQGFAAARAAR
ncbi:MAG: FecR family protein [Pseudomonadota bacterium]